MKSSEHQQKHTLAMASIQKKEEKGKITLQKVTQNASKLPNAT